MRDPHFPKLPWWWLGLMTVLILVALFFTGVLAWAVITIVQRVT